MLNMKNECSYRAFAQADKRFKLYCSLSRKEKSVKFKCRDLSNASVAKHAGVANTDDLNL